MVGTSGDNSIAANYQRLAAAQKPSAGVSIYSRYINRPWGRLLAAVFYPTGLTPNQVTGLSGLSSFGAMTLLLLTPPNPAVGLCVGFLLMFGFALDSADGQLARLRGGGSKVGEFLDHILDAGKTVLLHTAVLVTAWRFYPVPEIWYWVPLVFQATTVVLYSGTLIVPFLLAGEPRTVASPPTKLRSLILLPADHGVISMTFLLSGFPMVFAITYSALALANAVILVLLIIRWTGQLTRA